MFFAVAKTGLITVCSNYRLTPEKLLRIVNDSGPRAIIVEDKQACCQHRNGGEKYRPDGFLVARRNMLMPAGENRIEEVAMMELCSGSGGEKVLKIPYETTEDRGRSLNLAMNAKNLAGAFIPAESPPLADVTGVSPGL